MNRPQFNIEQKIRKDQIDALYERSKTASLGLLAIGTIYVALLYTKYHWQSLFSWYLVLLAVLAGRWLLFRFYVKAQKQTESLTFWLYLFRLGIIPTSLTLGSLTVLFFPEDSLPYLLLAIIIPWGIVGAASTMLVDFVSFFIYATSMAAPIIYQTALKGDLTYSGIGILTFMLLLFFLKFNKQYNNNFLLTMRLRYENMNLLEDLEQEKNKLNNRLGRIFNDSSNEIFVVDADSMQCLQVNMGAVENLGYSHKEFTNIEFFHIFTDLDRQSFTDLLAPLRDGSQETVVHKGINKRKDGSSYPVEARIQLSLEDSPPIVVVIAQDITERSEWEEKLIYQANFDQLTGMFNRHYMKSHMGSAIVRARRHRQRAALLFLDIDNFKHINDTLGHSVGDEILKQTSNRIQSLLRESDTPARTGGDEFAILLEDLSEKVDAEVVARKVVDTFKRPFIISEQEIYTTVSVGISIYPDDGESLDQLMQYADMAMYQVKDDGRNNYSFFSHDIRRFSEKQMQISNHLRIAMARSEFYLYYQPKVDINSRRIIGAEALLRWHNQELGDIPPDTFIPLAEKAGVIDEIGSWVLEMACREAQGWQSLIDGTLQVSVNISPQQFRSGVLVEDMQNALSRSGLPADLLELEITESLLLQDSYEPLAILKNIADQGVRLALDDFGTGYSSLSYLRRFPLQVLKIDRSFITGLNTDESSRTLVEAIIAMAHSLNLQLVAEGVEKIEELEFLQQRNVEIAQGYLFSPPISAEQFRRMLSVADQSLDYHGLIMP